MAVLVPSMSAIPHIQNHMTDPHGHSASSGLSERTTNVATQSSSKRPKLSLQTTSLANTYGALTRGLVPNPGTQATFTPTTTNTLANTWDLSIRPSPVSRTDSPRPPLATVQAPQQPYVLSLPFGVKPILKNSPLPPRKASVSASPRDSRRKVFFPQPKRVAFKRNLEDFIETTNYVARHSDLTSSSSEESSDEERQPDASTLSPPNTEVTGSQSSPPPSRKRKNRRDSGIYIETNIEHMPKEGDEESASATTPALIRKRRKWSLSLSPRRLKTDELQANEKQPDDDAVDSDPPPQNPIEVASDYKEPLSSPPVNLSLRTDNVEHQPVADVARRSVEEPDAGPNSADPETRSAPETS